jgi:hypothetical protein
MFALGVRMPPKRPMLRIQNQRHSRMHRLQCGCGRNGENSKGLLGLTICASVSIPDTGQPQNALIPGPDEYGLFFRGIFRNKRPLKIPVCRYHGSPQTKGFPKQRLRRDGFHPRIDRPYLGAGTPARQESPAHGHQFETQIRSLTQDRMPLTWCTVVRRRECAMHPKTSPGLLKIFWTVNESIASAHASSPKYSFCRPCYHFTKVSGESLRHESCAYG